MNNNNDNDDDDDALSRTVRPINFSCDKVI